MKKMFVLLLTAALLASAASAKPRPSDFTPLLISSLLTTEADIIQAYGGFSDAERENYAGVYIDDHNTIVLMFREGSGAKDRPELNMRVRTASFTVNELEDANELVIREMSGNYLKSAGISYSANAVKVGVSPEADIDTVKAKLTAMIENELGVSGDILAFSYDCSEFEYL